MPEEGFKGEHVFFVFVLRKTPALTKYDLCQETSKQAESTDTEAHILDKMLTSGILMCTASTLESNNIGLSWSNTLVLVESCFSLVTG